ncbi:12517_t:CDS:2, partial [Funneliformis mosseae]
NEFTELEDYLTKEYEDLKSLWLEFNEQYAKAKSEEEVLVQMLSDVKGTTVEESQNSLDYAENLVQSMYEDKGSSSPLKSSPISLSCDPVNQESSERVGNDVTDSFDSLTLSSPNISEMRESIYTALELSNRDVLQDSVTTESSLGFNTNLDNALRKLQRLDEEDYDIDQDEEMTDIISLDRESEKTRILTTYESDNDHEIDEDDEIEYDGWNEDKTRLALRDMLDMMRDQNNH